MAEDVQHFTSDFIPVRYPASVRSTPHAGVPIGLVMKHIDQLWQNHRMTAYSLHRRGVLPSEAVAILEDRPKRQQSEAAALDRRDVLIAQFNGRKL